MEEVRGKKIFLTPFLLVFVLRSLKDFIGERRGHAELLEEDVRGRGCPENWVRLW